jgi:L-lactate dehydrogenase (cytochrome)
MFGKRRSFGNLSGRIAGASGIRTLSEWIATQFDPAATWHDVEWVRSRWKGKLILKGIMEPEDAKLALASGADAIVVSNHGGRQLDGAPSTISVLPEIAAAVANRCDVLFDGGVRSGQDVLRALASGARGVLIGKSFLYALAAGGEAGVTRALAIIQKELAVTMALVGRTTLRDLDTAVLRPTAQP